MYLGPFYLPISFDPLSFALGFVVATLFLWLLGNLRPVFDQMRENSRQSKEEAKARTSTPAEDSYRKIIYRRVQSLHVASSLFSLDEIVQPVHLLAPPPQIEPDMPPYSEDVVSMCVPYMPSWPELAATYNAPTLTLSQALGGGMNIVIAGQPGTGKTVALADFVSQIVTRNRSVQEWHGYVPVYVHAADLNLPVKNPAELLNAIIDAISEDAPLLALSRLPGFIQSIFQNKRAILLLDDVDELAPPAVSEIVDYLKVLIMTYPGLRIVTTGAQEHVDGLLGLGFALLVVMPWNERQQADFLEKWGELWTKYVVTESWALTAAEPVDPMLLNQWLSLDNNTGLTPLEFTLKTWGAYAGDGRGPRALDILEAHIRRLSPQNTPAEAMQILAMQSNLTAQSVFDSHKAREWVRRFEPPEEAAPGGAEAASEAGESTEGAADPERGKQKAKKQSRKRGGQVVSAPSLGILSKMVDSGLLTIHRGSQMRFIHIVFSGFLAGHAMPSYGSSETLASQPAWSGRNLTMRYTSAFGDGTSLLDTLLQQEDRILERPILTAARWLRDAPRQAPWRGKMMTGLIDIIQNSVAPMGLRGQALAAFAFSGDPGIPTLFRQLGDSPAPELRQLAALGAGVIKDAKAVDTLAQRTQDNILSVRQAACLALVAINTAPALEAVATLLLRGDEDQRRAAAEALASHPAEGYATLRDGSASKDILLRRAVVYGLARIDQPWATQMLEKIQIDDDQWVVRNAAAEELESRKQLNPRIPRKLKAPSSTPWVIAFAGRFGMGVTPGQPATDLMLLALKSEQHEERFAALSYLRQVPSEGVIGALYNAMYSGNYELREAAFTVLSEFASTGMRMPHPQEFGLD
jgi:HEAT repeat protein